MSGGERLAVLDDAYRKLREQLQQQPDAPAHDVELALQALTVERERIASIARQRVVRPLNQRQHATSRPAKRAGSGYPAQKKRGRRSKEGFRRSDVVAIAEQMDEDAHWEEMAADE